jgi:flagellar protein FlaF
MARAAYASPAAPIRTPRDIEYDALARVTCRLKQAASLGDGSYSALAEALHDNRLLWTALAADVAGDDNGLPRELRARLFYLAEFAVAHGRKVLGGAADPQVLIDINTAVMRGLRGEEPDR